MSADKIYDYPNQGFTLSANSTQPKSYSII